MADVLRGLNYETNTSRRRPRGRAWLGRPCLLLKNRGRVRTWMPGTRPGKGLLEPKFSKFSNESPLNFPGKPGPRPGTHGRD